jgi:hypothetical protein
VRSIVFLFVPYKVCAIIFTYLQNSRFLTVTFSKGFLLQAEFTSERQACSVTIKNASQNFQASFVSLPNHGKEEKTSED